MADNKAKLTTESASTIELDILTPTLGQDVIDVRTLGSKGISPTTLDLPLLLHVNQKSLTLMVIKAFCCTAVFQLTNWQPKPLLRGLLHPVIRRSANARTIQYL